MSRFRYYLWTDYHKSQEDNLYAFDDHVQYAVWQQEEGRIANRLHYQGFLQLKEGSFLKTIKDKYFNSTTHLEAVKKIAAAKKYCSKLKTRVAGPWTFGTDLYNILNKSKKIESKPKKVVDVEEIASDESKIKTANIDKHNEESKIDLQHLEALINAGETEYTIMMNSHYYYKKYKNEMKVLLKEYENHLNTLAYSSELKEKAKLVFMTGDPGTGKSTIVDCLASMRGIEMYVYEGPWWPSYVGQPILFIDECAKGSVSFTALNMKVDRRQLTVPVKGSSKLLAVNEIYIATNYTFDQLFRTQDGPVKGAVERRIDVFMHFTKVEKEVTVHIKKFNTTTRELTYEGYSKYMLDHKSEEEGRSNCELFVNQHFLGEGPLADKFIK
jgi:hypothetical protein